MPSSLQLSLTEYDAMVRVGAFDRLPRKVELIRGELFEMNPAGPLHDHLITYLNNWSVRHADPGKTLVTSQTGLDLPEQVSRPEPDLMWLRRANYRTSHPQATDVQLAIEVAYSSLGYDLDDKRRLYASAGIVEYWIVDALAQCIHLFVDPEQNDYGSRNVCKVGDTLSPAIATEANLDLNDLFNGEV